MEHHIFLLGLQEWFVCCVGSFLNGITFAMDSVGRGTYFRRNASDGKLATIFGYFDTIANFWWVVAALSECG